MQREAFSALQHSQAAATRISISYTDKCAFSLPDKFPHEKMEGKRFPQMLTLFSECPQRDVCVLVAETEMCHLIIQIQNKLLTTEMKGGSISHWAA